MEDLKALVMAMEFAEMLDNAIAGLSVIVACMRNMGMPEELITEMLNDGARHYEKEFEGMGIEALAAWMEVRNGR